MIGFFKISEMFNCCCGCYCCCDCAG